eukprot:TRINITY_DN5497_c1_g1_i4.p1 TRINITY_DN5497_c1_g1~~TRINITY_DN5497_c1_g1_i4.p1  ORF type:complete len:868 (-),score=202.39 TRINITY_DN5497_c1_g1_i4:422-3025(-)
MKKHYLLVVLTLTQVFMFVDGTAALVGRRDGRIEIFEQTSDDWEGFFTYYPEIYVPPQSFPAIFPIMDANFVRLWLLVGASVKGNYTNFVIFNSETGAIQPHPQFIVYGTITAAIQYDDHTFIVAGSLQGNGLYGPGGVMSCQIGVGCFPLFDQLNQLLPLNPTYQFVAARSLIWLYTRNFASITVWEFSPFVGWRIITDQLDTKITFTAASGSIYVAADMTSLENLAIAERCTIEPVTSPFGILRINPEVETGSCEIVVTSNNTLFVEDGSSIQLVWSECIYKQFVGFNNCTCHIWPSSDSNEGRWSIQFTDLNLSSKPNVLVLQDMLLLSGDNSICWASTSHPTLTDTSYDRSYELYVIEGKIWAFNFQSGYHITYGAFNPVTADNSHGFDVVGPPVVPLNGCGSSGQGQTYILTWFNPQSHLLQLQDQTLVTSTNIYKQVVCGHNAFLLYDFGLVNVTVYYDGIVYSLPPIPGHLGYQIGDFGKSQNGNWLVALTFDFYLLCELVNDDWNCAVANVSTFGNLWWKLYNGSLYIYQNPQILGGEIDIAVVTCDTTGTLTCQNPEYLGLAVFSQSGSAIQSLAEGPHNSILFAGSFCTLGRFYSCYRILQYFQSTRNYILLDEYFQGQSPANFIYYANDDIYLIASDHQAYVTQLGGIPMPIDQFVSATALSFFEVTLSVMTIEVNTTDNGWMYKLALAGMALVLIGVVVGHTYLSRVEYIKVQMPLHERFTDMAEHKGRFLARGVFGTVSIVRHPNGGLYAAKYIDIKKKHFEELALREIEILKSLQHKNTIHLRDFIRSQDKIIIYTDLFDGATPDFYKKRIFSLSEVMQIARDLALALEYIHSLEIVHRDIKVGFQLEFKLKR